MRFRTAWPAPASRARPVPRAAVWLVRALVLASCVLAGAWLAGVSGVGEATRAVTLLSCVGIVTIAVREHPEAHRGRSGRVAVRLTLATAFVLAGVIALTLIFR
jgi:hypothetical protein